MPYKLSRCISVQGDREGMVRFYGKVLGLRRADSAGSQAEFSGDALRMFVDDHDGPRVVLELIVPNLEQAQAELLAAGCRIIRWEGRGKDCYIRDPFGIVFNIWENQSEFA